MPRLVAVNLKRYASRDLKSGEEFEASESDAKVLIAAGKASLAETDDKPQPRKGARYRRSDMRSED